jgi:tRNA threonylcarbamoyladenosine biosynthesis protein TsaE
MRSFFFEATDEASTAALGTALATVLEPGTVVGLYGTLGAGKTRLVQAIAQACEVTNQQVVSPTFVLLQEYEGRIPLYHFDAYRMPTEDEFLELGPDDYFEGSGLTLIEWAERVEGCLPRQRVEIHIEVTGVQTRRIEVRAVGAKYEVVIDRLQAWQEGDFPG